MRSLMAVALALGVAMAASADARPRRHPAATEPHQSFFEALFHPSAAPAPAPTDHRRGRARRAHPGRVAAISGRPADCYGIPWCGCWLRHHLGIADARLNRALAWASVGARADGPAEGVVAVWRHHVGLITENLGGGMIRLLSGNDGHAVRNRVRSTRGIIAYRKV